MSRPPRLPALLLRLLLSRAEHECVAGDLDEEYRRIATVASSHAARRWYWRQTLRSIAACRQPRSQATDRSRQTPTVVLRDVLRGSARRLWRQPLYAITCAVTLALAIAAATASVAVVRKAFLAPLPYAAADRLGSILTSMETGTSALSPHVLQDLRAARAPFEAIAPVRPLGMTHAGTDRTDTITANAVTPEYFTVLGVLPAIGTTFGTSDRRVVVLSWRFWQGTLAADPGVVGRHITLDGEPHRVVGVMPQEFVAPYFAMASVWLPLDMAPLMAEPRARRTLTVLARLSDRASWADADTFLRTFSARLQAEHAVLHGRQTWVARPLRDELVGSSRPALLGTTVASGLLLLIVGTSIAGLSTAHALATRHQRALRTALGATRGRLLLDDAADAAVVSAIGAAAGVWGAGLLVAAVAEYQAQFLPRLGPLTLDPWSAVAGLAAGVAVGVGASLVPRHVVGRSTSMDALRGARGSAGALRGRAIRSGLVVAQVAVTLVLIVGAGLLVRTVRHLSSMPLGFDTTGLTTFFVNLPGSRYATSNQQIAFERTVVERLRRLHGVSSAVASVGFPVVGGMGASLAIEGRPMTGGLTEVAYFSVSPDFMPALRMPLRAGRYLAPTDTLSTTPVVVINDTMARQYWPEGNAVGARARIGPGTNSPWITVVGVVEDVRQHGPTEQIRATAFGSTWQYSWPRRYFTVRADRDPVPLAAELRALMHDLDPAVAISTMTTVDDMAADRLGRHRLVMLAVGVFGAVSLGLCGAGLYAVVAFTSHLRRREYAVRLALGAARPRLRWSVVRQSLLLAGAGAAGGLGAAGFSVRAIRGLLHGVAPLDPLTFTMAAAVVMLLAAAAAIVPAVRAGRIDPIEALRAE